MERHDPAPTRAGFIGAGRVARALALAAGRAGIDVVAAWSPTPASRERFAAEFGIEAASTPDQAVVGCDVVVVAVPDEQLHAAVEDAIVRVPAGASPLVVITSGSASIDALAVPAGRARVVRMHPLRAITGTEAAGALDGVVAAVTAPRRAELEAARGLARRLSMRPVDLADDAAPAWHAAGALAAGGVVTLVAAARDLAIAAGIDEHLALEAMSGLARGAIDRAADEGPETALTGPVVRGDAATVAAHARAIAEQCPVLTALHAELTRATADLAARSGRIDEPAAGRIETALDRAGEIGLDAAPLEARAWA